MQKQDEIKDKLEQLEREMWFLVKTALPSLKEELLAAGGNKTKIQELEKKINDTITNVESLQSQVIEIKSGLTTLDGKVEGQETDIVACQATLRNHASTIQSHESMLSEFGTIQAGQTEILNEQGNTLKNQATIINNINESVDGFSSAISALQISVNQHQEDISNQATEMSKLESSIKTNSNKISVNEVDIQKNAQSLYAINESIDILEQNVAGHGVKIVNNENNIIDINKTISTHQADIALNKNNISTNSSNLSNLTTRVTNLENKPSGGGGGRTLEVIYDSTSDDPNLNKGFPGGMIGGKNFTWTEKYDSIRIYAKCVANFGYLELPKTNRPTDDFTIYSVAAAGRIVYAWKGMLYNNENKLSVGRGYIFTLDTSAGTWTMAGAMQEKFWVTRVEGIKGV